MENSYGLEPLAVVAKYQTVLPVNLDMIAHDLGIRVFDKPLGSNISGMLIRDHINGGTSGFAIFLNFDHAPNRKRFTFAHELAHFILHRDLIESGLTDDTMYRSELSNVYEVQANRMAADILMPIRLVKIHRADKSPQDLARLFGVSEAAMKIRLEGVKA